MCSNHIFATNKKSLTLKLTKVREYAKRLLEVSNEFRQKYKEIPWKNIAGMRDIVVHNYETIDKLILWNVADKETLKVKEFCKKIVNER